MYKISPELLQKILDYLAVKPYAEVYNIIQEIQKLEQINKEG